MVAELRLSMPTEDRQKDAELAKVFEFLLAAADSKQLRLWEQIARIVAEQVLVDQLVPVPALEVAQLAFTHFVGLLALVQPRQRTEVLKVRLTEIAAGVDALLRLSTAAPERRIVPLGERRER